MQLSFSGGHTQSQTHPFILRQIFNTKSYDIETTTRETINGKSNIYNKLLSTLSDIKWSYTIVLHWLMVVLHVYIAQNINIKFDCSWCDSDMCSERSVCTNNIVTMSGDCPNPVINNLLPQMVLLKEEHKLPYMVVIWVPSPQIFSLLII